MMGTVEIGVVVHFKCESLKFAKLRGSDVEDTSYAK